MKWRYSLGFGSFIITLVLFLTILLPLFTKQEPVSATVATIGNTAVGASAYTLDVSIRGINATVTAGSGRADYMKVSLYYSAAGGPWDVQCAIYDGSWNEVALTESKSIALTSTKTWYQFNFTGTKPILTDGVKYKLCVGGLNNPVGTGQIASATSGGDYFYEAYTGWPNPLTGLTFGSRNPSIYCNYTVNTAPTFVNPSPANGSTGVSLNHKTNLSVYDGEGNTLTVTWWNNKTGSYVKYAQNNSVTANSTLNIPESWASVASTRYFWRVNAFDGIVNSSAWYYFTTAEEEAETSLRLIQTASTGTITNVTNIRLVQMLSSGQIENLTRIRLVQSANNGAILNQTLLRLVQSANNGAINNLTRLRLTQMASNGLIQNLSTLHLIQTASSGVVQNLTFLHLIQTASNGAVVNLSVLHLVQTASNGAILNGSELRLVQIASNGVVQNLSVSALTLVQTASTGTVMNSTVLHLIQKADTGTINSFILLRLVQTAGSGTILNLSRILLVQTASTGTIRNISTGIGIVSVYPANHSTNILRNVTYHVTIFHTAGLPMRITWLRDNGTVYLGSSIDVYNGTYFIFSNASLANHVYNWSVNITDGVSWLNQSQWYRTGMSTAGGGLVVTGGSGRMNAFLLIGVFGGMMFGLVLWRRKKGKKEK